MLVSLQIENSSLMPQDSNKIQNKVSVSILMDNQVVLPLKAFYVSVCLFQRDGVHTFSFCMYQISLGINGGVTTRCL